MAEIKLLYNQKDITAYMAPYLIGLEYRDQTEGQSDELSITVDNKDRYWSDSWYPESGAELTAQIIQADQQVLNCGTFELDQVEFSLDTNGGNLCTIKALGAGIKQAIRTHQSYAHENKTLQEIAKTIADKYGWTVQGDIPNVTINRETQYRDTPLSFLSRISAEYGLVFSIRNKTMTFTSIFTLEDAPSVLSIYQKNVITYRIVDKTADSYLLSNAAHFHPQQKKVVKGNHTDDFGFSSSPKVDYFEIRPRMETAQQAELITKAALYRANALQREGWLTMAGDILLVSGVNIELPVSDWQKLAGNYHIISSTHKVDKNGGWTVDIDVKSIGQINADKAQNAV